MISIIIPVYNSAAWLPSCLESLLAQTMPDWEAICVNDGSKDNSLHILEQYAARDPRIRIIEQENSGVSQARNKALDAAKGEFILFLDSDDALHPQTLAIVLNKQVEQPYSWICFQSEKIADQLFDSHIAKLARYQENEPSSKKRSLNALGILLLRPYGWDKLYRRSIIEAQQIRFLRNVPLNEDLHFVFQYAMHQKEYCCIQVPLYAYRTVENSACQGSLSLTRPVQHYTNHIDIHLPFFEETKKFPLWTRLNYQLGIYLKIMYQSLHFVRHHKKLGNPRPDIAEGFETSFRKLDACCPIYLRIPAQIILKSYFGLIAR